MLEILRRSRMTMSSAFLLSANSRQSKANFLESISFCLISPLKCLNFRKDKGHYGGSLRRPRRRQANRPASPVLRAPGFAKPRPRWENHVAAASEMAAKPAPALLPDGESPRKSRARRVHAHRAT